MEWAETLWPVKYATSCFGAAAPSNHLHDDHVAQARKGRSVLTETWSGFTRHITPDYLGENSSVTFLQITHTVDQRSGSNLQEAPPTTSYPTPSGDQETWPWPRPRSRQLPMQPSDTLAVQEAGEETWPLPWIHNCRSAGSPVGVPVQHFLLAYLLFIILISLANSHSQRCVWGLWVCKTASLKSAEKQRQPFGLLITAIDLPWRTRVALVSAQDT